MNPITLPPSTATSACEDRATSSGNRSGSTSRRRQPFTTRSSRAASRSSGWMLRMSIRHLTVESGAWRASRRTGEDTRLVQRNVGALAVSTLPRPERNLWSASPPTRLVHISIHKDGISRNNSSVAHLEGKDPIVSTREVWRLSPPPQSRWRRSDGQSRWLPPWITRHPSERRLPVPLSKWFPA